MFQGLHSASVPGILALDLSGDSSRALTGKKFYFAFQVHLQLTILSFSLPPITGGADKTAIVFDKDSGKIVATLKGHSKKVTSAVYHPREVCRPHPHSNNNMLDYFLCSQTCLQDIAVTASPDSTIRVWNVDTAACSQVIKVGINILICIVYF